VGLRIYHHPLTRYQISFLLGGRIPASTIFVIFYWIRLESCGLAWIGYSMSGSCSTQPRQVSFFITWNVMNLVSYLPRVSSVLCFALLTMYLVILYYTLHTFLLKISPDRGIYFSSINLWYRTQMLQKEYFNFTYSYMYTGQKTPPVGLNY